MPSFSLTVHTFNHVNGAASSPSTDGGNTVSNDDELLARGQHLVKSAFAKKGWKSVVPPRATPIVFDRSRTYTFKKPPPLLPLGGERTPVPLREWGDLSPEEEVIDLAEFVSMDVSEYLQTKKCQRKRSATDESEGEAPCKKPRKAEEDLNLYALIPKPHHHSYPRLVPQSLAFDEVKKRFKPYSKSPFQPVSPHNFQTAKRYLTQPFSRSAWIIPVCGNTPCESASSATLRPAVAETDDVITWTPTLLTEFWNFLLAFRSKGALGAISLSYHVAPLTGAEGILQCTYIKVYHDGRFALFVRAVLDAWGVESKSDDVTLKIRPLLRKTLTLVDERGILVGVC